MTCKVLRAAQITVRDYDTHHPEFSEIDDELGRSRNLGNEPAKWDGSERLNFQANRPSDRPSLALLTRGVRAPPRVNDRKFIRRSELLSVNEECRLCEESVKPVPS